MDLNARRGGQELPKDFLGGIKHLYVILQGDHIQTPKLSGTREQKLSGSSSNKPKYEAVV